MISKSLLSVFFILCVIFAFETTSAQKWGEISDKEWSQQPIVNAPPQGAIILFDKGFVVTELKGLTFSRHTRIKIFTSEGLNLIKDVAIEYYSYDYLYDIKVHIIRPTGEVIKLDKHDFIVEKNGNKRVTRISFEQAAPGDIIEYKYKIDYYGGVEKLGPEKYFMFSQEMAYCQFKKLKEIGTSWDKLLSKKISNIPNWYFDNSIYCLHSEMIVKLGSDLDYVYFTTNIPSENSKPESRRGLGIIDRVYKYYTWVMDSIPPFIPDTTGLYEEELSVRGFTSIYIQSVDIIE